MALLFVTLPFVVRTVQPVLIELDRRDGGGRGLARRQTGSRSSAASSSRTSCRRSSPGVALAFARAVGEFGAVILISGNLPVQDRGRLALRLRADQQRRHDRRGRTRGAAARDLACASCSRSAPCGAGPPAMTVKAHEIRDPRLLARLPGDHPPRAGRADLLAVVRARLRPVLGGGLESRRDARAAS